MASNLARPRRSRESAAAPARAVRPRRQATPFQTIMAAKYRSAVTELNSSCMQALQQLTLRNETTEQGLRMDYMRQSEEIAFRFGLCHNGDRVIAFGSDEALQLGQPTHARMVPNDIQSSHGPLVVEGLNALEVRQVAAGGLHSAALTNSGAPYTFGLNDYGILGRSFQVAEANADDEDAVAVAAATPTAVTGFVTVNGLVEDGSISQVACGKSHTLYLSINGNVYSSGFYRAANGEHYRDGSEPEGHNDMPIHIGDELLSGKTVRIYSGETASYSVGITEDGNMLTWGFGNNGQLARGAYTGDNCLTPAPVVFEDGRDKHVLHVACGSNHLLVVARPPGGSAGETLVYSAGYNIWGQLGYRLPDNVQEVHTLRVIPSLTGANIAKVAAGSSHSLAMDRFGKAIYSWGCGRNGELGLGLPEDGTGTELIRFEPVRVPVPAGDSLPVFKDISAGGSQSAAVTITGELFTWGAGHMQATGHGTEGDENVWYMTQLDLQPVAGHDHEVMQVSTGEHHTLVLTRHQAAGN